MQSNWSLILNVLLLVGVIVAIGRIMKARRRTLSPQAYPFVDDQVEPSIFNEPSYNDDIIAVRKVSGGEFYTMDDAPVINPISTQHEPAPKIEAIVEDSVKTPTPLMIFIVAKENRQFAGYELLQTVLACGLRYGEGNLFYRHQFANGQGPVLCGLAAATAKGTFDMPNIGAFSAKGLCLFMHVSNNSNIDGERFSIMLDTAKQLSEGLDAILLDDQRKPLTSERMKRYYNVLNIG